VALLQSDDARNVDVRRRRLGRPDPVAFVVGLVALLVYCLQGFDAVLDRDLAVYAYAGQQVVDGVPPYIGVVNRAGPLAHLLPAVGVAAGRLTGLDDLLATRVWFLLIAVACVVVVYVVARNAFASRSAGVVSAAALLSFEGFGFLASSGPREKTPMLFFVLLALWALTRARWFTAGVFVGLATLCLQIALFPTLAAVVAWILLGPRATWLMALLRVAAGGAATLALAVVSFIAVGALREFVDGFVLLNARYTRASPPLAKLDRVWDTLVNGFGASLWVLLGGLAALVILAAGPVWRRGLRGTTGSALVVSSAAGAVGAVLWSLRDYDNWPDAFLLLPFGAFGAGAVIWALAPHLSPRVLVALTGTATALLTLVALLASLEGGRDQRLVAQRRSVQAVLAVLPDDATIVSVEAPQPLVLSGRTNPTRHQMFAAGLGRYVDDTWPGGTLGYFQSILDSDAELVAVGSRLVPSWRPRLEKEYEVVGRAPGWTWFARRSLGEDVLAELRDAARRSGQRRS
jgi:hypothetical protein